MINHPASHLPEIARRQISILARAALLFLPILLLSASGSVAQEISVSAAVNTTTVEPGETLRYTIQIESSSTPPVTTPSPPDVEGLEFVGTSPRASRNISIVGGRIHQRMSFEWTLRATNEGRAQIGSTFISVDESEHRTEPIEITVDGGSAAAQNRSSRARSGPPEHNAENVFIRVRASDTDVYTNEQLTVEYILYFREDFQVQNSRMASSWKADGLWREELEVDQHPLPETEVVNGLRYNTITLKRSAFFPARQGSLTIEPLSIETEILRPYTRNDPFNFRIPRDERLYSANIASPAVPVTARPLPDGAPSSFSGAVGSFTLDHEIDRTTTEAGEAVTLTITVAGRGNVSTLGKPEFDLPKSIELYDPKVTTQVDRDGHRLEGRKTFSYTLVPRNAGSFRLAPVRWSFFDPDRAKFITRGTGPIELEVEPPSAPRSNPADSGLPADDIAGLLITSSVAGTDTAPPLHRQIWPYAAIAGPAAALILLLGFRRWRDHVDQTTSTHTSSSAKQELSRADKLRRQDQPRAFYDAVERSIRGLIGARLHIPAQGLTKRQIVTHLDDADIPAEVAMTVRELLRTCERARYSPDGPDSRALDAVYERTADCLARLETLLADGDSTSSRRTS